MTPPRIALATAIAAFAKDDDLAPLQGALHAAGAEAEVLAWDDASVSWSRFDAVVLRSTWDYAERLDAFLAWCAHVHTASRLINAPDVVHWNTDKHYLAELAAAGVPTIPSLFLEPSSDAHVQTAQAQLEACLSQHDEFVIKPAVGAGAREVQRYTQDRREGALAHIARLHAARRSVLIQPYLTGVDQRGETALIFIDGQFSHAVRKGPLLARNGAATDALFAAESIRTRTATREELDVARKALAAQPFGAQLYARVDLLPSPDGPLLLELELTEPSLFFAHAPGAAERFAQALLARLAASAPALPSERSA